MSNRTAITIISFISTIAIGFLFWLIYGVQTGSGRIDFSYLPTLNASFNALSATALVVGLRFISKGMKREHGYCMAAAFVASTSFLIGYMVHHTINGDTKFVAADPIRYVYYAILISHVLLSMVVLPMVLTTFFFAAMRRWENHRKLARWTWPIWLYVSITGVVVFAFLRFLNEGSDQ